MSALTSSSAEDRLESLLKPYRDRSNAHIQAIWEEFAAEHPVGAFPSSRTMRDNSRLFTAGEGRPCRPAPAGYRPSPGEPRPPGLPTGGRGLPRDTLHTARSEGQGRETDCERADRIPEPDKVGMRGAKTARLDRGAAATAAIAARASSEDRAALEACARNFAIAFQDRDDLLGAGVVESRIGGSAEGDIRQGKRTRLFVLAVQRLAPKGRASFLRAYGRGPRTTKNDIRSVRNLFRENVLPTMEARIADHLVEARRALDRLPPKDPEARKLLETLLEAQRTRVR